MPSPALAALLALAPLAAPALLAWLARPLGRGERAVLVASAVVFAGLAVIVPQAPQHDPWTHYEHLRAALVRPVGLLDAWDRPGFTLLFAGPAAAGPLAARLAAGLPAAVALAATMRAAAGLGLRQPWLAGLLLVGQHDVLAQASSTMTELTCAAALAVAAVGWLERRPGISAAGLGWAAITRPEGALYAAAGAAGLLLRGERRAALAVFLPFAAWVAVGALAWSDPLWLVHGNPYATLVGPRFEARQLVESFFFTALWWGQPAVLLALEVAGFGLAVSGAGGAARFRFLLPFLAASYLLLCFLRIGPTDAWRESRYLVALSPALALLAAAALEALSKALSAALPARRPREHRVRAAARRPA